MNPQEFLNIASYLYNLSTPQLHTSPEIIRRTHVNRAYYYLYHLARKETIAQLEDKENFHNLPEWLNKDHIHLKEKFRDHKLLRHFYEKLYDETNYDEARKVHHILSRYNIYRILADYHIDTCNPSIGRYRLNFQNPNPQNPSWKELTPPTLQKRGNELVESICNLFSNRLKNEDTTLYTIITKIL